MKEIVYVVKATGTSPMLMEKLSATDLPPFVESTKRKKTQEDIMNEWKSKVYITSGKNPVLYIPRENIKKCLVNAGSQIKSGVRTKGRDVAGSIRIKTDGILKVEGKEISLDRAEKEKMYELVVVNRKHSGKDNKVGVTRARIPEGWTLEFTVSVINSEAVSASVLDQVMYMAGSAVGLGPWRPERRGEFGMFEIASITEKK
jgi:hypothetical protein